MGRSPRHNNSCLRLGLILATVAFMPSVTRAGDFLLPKFIDAYCIGCHNSETQKGGLDLQKLSVQPKEPAVFATWMKVHDRTQAGDMPPKARTNRPDKSEADAFLKELQATLTEVDRLRRSSGPEPKDADKGQLAAGSKLMFDLIRLALETDSTRLVTLFIHPLGVASDITGVEHETHSMTHHGNRPDVLAELRKLETAQFQALAGLLAGLKGTREGSETLLDRTMVLYGTCMGSANAHSNTNLPLLLAGGGFKHVGLLAFDTQRNYPLANLYVSMLQRLGLETDKFASSTGTMRGLELS